MTLITKTIKNSQGSSARVSNKFSYLINLGMALACAILSADVAYAHEEKQIKNMECTTLVGDASLCVFKTGDVRCVILRGHDMSEMKCIGEQDD